MKQELAIQQGVETGVGPIDAVLVLRKRWLLRQGFEVLDLQVEENRVLLQIVVLCGVLTAEHAVLLKLACRSLGRDMQSLLRLSLGRAVDYDLETRIASCKEILSSAFQEQEKVEALSSILSRTACPSLVSAEEEACLTWILQKAFAPDELYVPQRTFRKHC